MNSKFHNRKGFTMIELLIVVLMISILSGIIINVVNAPRRERDAADSIKKSMIYKAAESIESFRTMEGNYPADLTAIPNYLIWPPREPEGAVYTYNRYGADAFFIWSVSEAEPTIAIKYDTSWRSVRECAFTASDTGGGC